MSDIIEQARELLAVAERVNACPPHIATVKPDVIAALCRALIVRTDALRDLLDAEDALDADPSGGACDRYKAAYRATRRALQTEQGSGDNGAGCTWGD